MKERNSNISVDKKEPVGKYIQMIYNDLQCIKIAEDENGNYMLHIEDTKNAEDHKRIVVSEDTLVSIIASTIIYFEHYGTNIMNKTKEVLGTKSIRYSFPSEVDFTETE